jgi:Rps23 Pro-64 3,4-dihydroxylase Tpa1-like proline 4-hydroxylase
MVTKYENVLSDELYIEVIEYVNNIIKNKKTKLTSSNLEWDDKLKGNSEAVLRYEFDNSDSLIFKKIKKELENKIPYFIQRMVLHLWPNLSYITWHDDSQSTAALTLYLNKNWDDNWGGYLMYKEDNEIKAIKPEKNLAVLQENKVGHCVTTINMGADTRISLQFFLKQNLKKIKTLL